MRLWVKWAMFTFERDDRGVRIAPPASAPSAQEPHEGRLGLLAPFRRILQVLNPLSEATRQEHSSEPPAWQAHVDRVELILEGLDTDSAETVADILTELWTGVSNAGTSGGAADAFSRVLSNYPPDREILSRSLEIAEIFQVQHQQHAERSGSMGSLCVDGRRAAQIVYALEKKLAGLPE